MTKRVRTTITVSPETLEVFKRMAAAGNMSMSSCIGDWLDETAEGAQLIALKMEEAKRAPMRVLNEMKAVIAGMNDMVNEDMAKVRQAGSVRGASARPASPSAPSSNTGLKSPTRAKQSGGKS